ncbi:HTH_Tnp_Tc3_2 domain-containing protein [Trichonephila clavipes]|nr:HTH_Tnp_Tc3_2 domain-containing protein [Trichonephila clavipes]
MAFGGSLPQINLGVQAFRGYWQECVDSGKFQLRDRSCRPRARADRQGRFTVNSAVTAPDSSLSTIRRATRTRVPTMGIHRRLIERNLSTYRPLRHLPITPACCQTRLQWLLARSDSEVENEMKNVAPDPTPCEMRNILKNQGPRNSSRRTARCRHVSTVGLKPTGDCTISASSNPNSRYNTLENGQGPPTSLPLPPTTRENL